MKKMRFNIVWILVVALASCSKDDNSPAKSVLGTWVFTNQLTFSFPYPSVLTNHNAMGSSSWQVSDDSIKMTFNSNGTFSFSNHHYPLDNGTYRIVQDSFLVIGPDTSDLIKFNYTYPVIIFSPTPIPDPPPPYQNFQFSSDTLLFKKTSNNNLVLTAVWLTKSRTPLIPSNDTLILNQSSNYFRRK